jgi:hypothetical protein
MAFDPDEYLRTPQQKQSGFDADQFLGSPQQESVFDVDAYLKQPQATTEQPSPQRKTLKERGTEVGTAGGLSAALGFVSPELFTLAGGLAATTPLTAPAAPFLFTTGQALRSQRLGQAGYGLLGGLMGETGGQVVEARGGTPFQAEVARFLGGTFGPEGVRQLGKAGGTVIARSLQAMGVPGASKISTIGQMLELDNKRPGTLTAEQRAFIDKKLNEIRGGKPSLQAQQEVADMLARTAQQRVSQAEQQASALERQADELLTAAQTRAGQIDANTQQRIGALQSQFENAAIGLRQDADTRARQAIEAGRQRANQIMQQVQGQSPQLQSVARIDADQAIAQAQQQADQIAAQAQQKMASLRAKRQRLIQTSQKICNKPSFKWVSLSELVTLAQTSVKVLRRYLMVYAKQGQTMLRRILKKHLAKPSKKRRLALPLPKPKQRKMRFKN